ncbi:unnamed protein product [Arctia plantaginis]|uniref:DDE-1 domain-containing protein n=1 Tax=Arctia plantaginis TaxID=874455 RepID=A0A8S1ALH4_ARCPL|nr:unnamed protein product [Arctia plantaginis]
MPLKVVPLADITRTSTSKYYHTPGIRRSYIGYTKTQLEECLAAIRAKDLTQQDASEFYKIPCSTIKYKLANKSNKNPGRQPTFTDSEEALFVKHISTLSECGFSFSNLDIKIVIRDYLNSRNRTVPLFRNNIPGKDWLKSFLDRHQSLYRRRVNGRAHVSEVSVTDFLEQVSNVIENVEPGNIYSYDEISFGDDLLKNTNVWRRKTKYPDIKTDALEACFTVMFCGNAEGEAIPPLIISKSEHRCSTWAENGPVGASYSSTKYGWIDVITFENWFLSHLLPILRKRKGRKVVIGDSLSSHISLKVLSASEKENIRFMCLPPNSIHVLQPLENVYYQPLQQIWFELLLSWKIFKIKGNAATTMKADFPCLLRAALDLLPDIKENLINGFKETGIYPLSTQEPLKRLNKIRIANLKRRKIEHRQYYSEQSGYVSEPLEEGSYSWQIEAPNSSKEFYLDYEDNISSPMSCNDWEASAEPSNDVCLVVVNGDDILLVQFQQSNSLKNLLNIKQKVQDIDKEFMEINKNPKPSPSVPKEKPPREKKEKSKPVTKEDVSKVAEAVVGMDL